MGKTKIHETGRKYERPIVTDLRRAQSPRPLIRAGRRGKFAALPFAALSFVALGLRRAAEARFSAFPGFLPRWHQKQEQI